MSKRNINVLSLVVLAIIMVGRTFLETEAYKYVLIVACLLFIGVFGWQIAKKKKKDNQLDLGSCIGIGIMVVAIIVILFFSTY